MKTDPALKVLSVLLFLTSACTFSARSQEPVKICLDFKSKEITDLWKLDRLKEGNTYQLVITDINLNLYKVSLIAKDSILEHKLEFPGFGSFTLDPITKLVGNLTPLETYLTSMPKGVTTSPRFNQLRADYPETVKLKAAELKQGENEPTEAQARARLECRRRIIEEQDTLKNLQSDLAQKKTEIDAMSFTVKKYVLSGQVEFEDNPAFGALCSAPFPFDSFIKRLDALRFALSGFQQSLAKHQSNYTLEMENYTEVLSKDDTLKKADREVKSTYNQLIKTVADALDSVNASKASDLIGSIVTVDNNKGREFRSLPIQFFRGQGSLKVNITPRDEKFGLQSYSTEIKFPWSAKGFMSVGSSFYISTLHDEAFSILGQVTKDSVTGRDTVKDYKIAKEKPGNVEFGIQAMMTAGFCGSKHGFWQVSFGPGVSITNKVRPRLLLGGGYAFGQRNLLTVNIGVIIGAVDRKSEIVDLNAPMPQKPEQLTVSRITCGGFLSLGYLFNL